MDKHLLKLYMTRGDAHLGIASFFALFANFCSCSNFHASNSRFASSVSKNAIISGTRHLAISFIKSSGISHAPSPVYHLSPYPRSMKSVRKYLHFNAASCVLQMMSSVSYVRFCAFSPINSFGILREKNFQTTLLPAAKICIHMLLSLPIM